MTKMQNLTMKPTQKLQLRLSEFLRQIIRRHLPTKLYSLAARLVTDFTTLRYLGISKAISFFKSRGKNIVVTISLPKRLNSVSLRGGTSDILCFENCIARHIYSCYQPTHEPQVIIDAGANIGASAVWFLMHYPIANLIALEPDINNFNLCQKNLAAFGSRVIIQQAALWSSGTELQVQNPDAAPDSLCYSQTARSSKQSISAHSMSDLMISHKLDRIDIFKCDVEGAEIEIFGDPNVDDWVQNIQAILIELHSPKAHEIVGAVMNRNFFRHEQYREVHIFTNPRQVRD